MTPDAHYERITLLNPSDRLLDGHGAWYAVFQASEVTIKRLAETEMNA